MKNNFLQTERHKISISFFDETEILRSMYKLPKFTYFEIFYAIQKYTYNIWNIRSSLRL